MGAPSAVEPDSKLLSKLLISVANGEISAAEVFGLHPYVLQKVTDRAVALLDSGKIAEGDALLESLTLVDGKSVTLPFLLGARRAQRNDHDRAISAYDEALIRAERTQATRLVQKLQFCRAQSFLATDQLLCALDDLRLAASGEDKHVAASAQRWLDQLDKDGAA